MNVITREFVDRMILSGPLTEAARRIRGGTARPKNVAHWGEVSTWALVCEEILDTEHADDWYDDVVAELIRRGFGFEQIDAMRRFAWETAGWLNYDRMLWERCKLDEDDIRNALDLQLRGRRITRLRYEEGLNFLEHSALACPSRPREFENGTRRDAGCFRELLRRLRGWFR
ncbi:hypothetical protein ACYOEI_01875 [Singulisphaera rosea]